MIDGSVARFTPLETLMAAARGALLPLPARLRHLYGGLRMPAHGARPHVYCNFVSTLDGVVSLSVPGHAGGRDISGDSGQDRMVMGLLRAISDAVIVGSGTLAADCRTVWTADDICPRLAEEYRLLRVALGLPVAPLNVIVSGGGMLNLRLPVFTSGRAPVLILTTAPGAKRLQKQKVPEFVQIQAIRRSAGPIPTGAILDAACQFSVGSRLLVEGGPHLLGEFCADRLIDEQFLTLAPQIAGRRAGDRRLSLVMGQLFAPRRALWGTLIDVRRGQDHLFLRYAFPVKGRTGRGHSMARG